jgi:two-component system cell cycle sensor histidine kinase/response regulator CckA
MTPAGNLRKAAERKLREESRQPEPGPPSLENLQAQSSDRAFETLHELRVHQIELEMQNDELRQTQRDLDASRARYLDLYDLAPAGYCSLSREGTILEANLTLATLLALPREQLDKVPFTRFLLPADQDLYYHYRKQLQDGGPPLALQLRMITSEGNAFWAELVATREHREDGAALNSRERCACRLMVVDVSARKQLEEENARLQERLRQSEKLETLGALAGGVAHDFNNLLTTILGNANLGSLAVEPDGRIAPFFLAIERASLKAAEITRQLMTYAGKGHLRMEELDLDIVTQEVVQLLRLSIPANLTLEVDLSDRLPYVKGDGTQLFQVLMNLVLNASESFPEGATGTIRVRTRTEELDEAFLESTHLELPLTPGRYATLEVTDTGTGMTPDVLTRIFEPFYTTKFLGRGLGLSALLGVLQGHRGGLRVQSTPDHGSSFKIFLPVMRERRALTAQEASPTWRGEGWILVAEDEAPVRATVVALAERLGFSSLEVADGREAVEAFRRHHADLSLVLLDYAMPGLDGRSAFKEMQLIDPTVPVILTSGYDLPPGVAPQEGFADVLRKPYRLAEMQGVLRRVTEARKASVS